MWNCDEIEATPNRDANGNGSSRAYVTRGSTADAKIGNFLNSNRVTMLPAVSAAGQTAPPFFVFKGARVPYRVMERNGKRVVQTFSEVLPRGALFSMREEGGGVDRKTLFCGPRTLFITFRTLPQMAVKYS